MNTPIYITTRLRPKKPYQYTIKMTKEEIALKIEEAKTEHYYTIFSHPPTISTFKYIVGQCLKEIGESKNIDLYCSPNAKLFIMEKFWVDDFNYLGTRIRLISEENLTTGITTIPGMDGKLTFLAICDGVAIYYGETLD